MNNISSCFKLNNGKEIPCMGYGTWQTPNGETAAECVKEAISIGYRHIDTPPATTMKLELAKVFCQVKQREKICLLQARYGIQSVVMIKQWRRLKRR